MDSVPSRKVLIALNKGKTHSDRAFHYYLNTFYKNGDQLLLAYIVEPTQIPAPLYASGPTLTCDRSEWDKMMGNMMSMAREVTAKYEKHCQENNIAFMTIWAAGSAGQGICDLAEAETADVIIIGNRGLGPIKRTLLGSVTDYVVQHSDVAVLVVPPSWSSPAEKMDQQKAS